MRCPVHRRFFLIRRSSIYDSLVRSSMSLFVTLSIQIILMIDRRCRIMKACSFFTCRLYTVQASAPYRRVDSTIARLFQLSMIYSSRVLVELGWYSISALLMLIFSRTSLMRRRKHPLFSASFQQSVQPVHCHMRIAALSPESE